VCTSTTRMKFDAPKPEMKRWMAAASASDAGAEPA
jgi:hypothetical protein